MPMKSSIDESALTVVKLERHEFNSTFRNVVENRQLHVIHTLFKTEDFRLELVIRSNGSVASVGLRLISEQQMLRKPAFEQVVQIRDFCLRAENFTATIEFCLLRTGQANPTGLPTSSPSEFYVEGVGASTQVEETVCTFDIQYATRGDNGPSPSSLVAANALWAPPQFRDLLFDSSGDFTIKVSKDGANSRIHAHRVVLASQLGYFKTLFSSGMKEANDNECIVADFSESTIRAVLEFIYRGRLSEYKPHDLSSAIQTFKAADYFENDALLEFVAFVIAESGWITVESFSEVFMLWTNVPRCKQLRSACVKFMAARHEDLAKQIESDHLLAGFVDLAQVMAFQQF
ncbi:hypothetical protein BJ742DRAFT_822365 [Cladochytrium replicatum]|nr:hypothetical protein BJ742DRAFT_822365 [Cladochytrium replicatum]